MTTATVTATLTIEIAGSAAADVADDLLIDLDAGELDQALLNAIRQHLADHSDTRDWRIVSAHLWPATDGEPQP